MDGIGISQSLAVGAANIAAGKEKGNREASIGRYDDGAAVAAGAEAFIAGALDLNLVVEPEVADVVTNDNIVKLESRHLAARQAGRAPQLGDFGAFIDKRCAQASQLAKALDRRQVGFNVRLHLRNRSVNEINARLFQIDLPGQFRDRVLRFLSAIKGTRLQHRIAHLGFVFVGQNVVVGENENLIGIATPADKATERPGGDLEMAAGYADLKRSDFLLVPRNRSFAQPTDKADIHFVLRFFANAFDFATAQQFLALAAHGQNILVFRLGSQANRQRRVGFGDTLHRPGRKCECSDGLFGFGGKSGEDCFGNRFL